MNGDGFMPGTMNRDVSDGLSLLGMPVAERSRLEDMSSRDQLAFDVYDDGSDLYKPSTHATTNPVVGSWNRTGQLQYPSSPLSPLRLDERHTTSPLFPLDMHAPIPITNSLESPSNSHLPPSAAHFQPTLQDLMQAPAPSAGPALVHEDLAGTPTLLGKRRAEHEPPSGDDSAAHIDAPTEKEPAPVAKERSMHKREYVFCFDTVPSNTKVLSVSITAQRNAADAESGGQSEQSVPCYAEQQLPPGDEVLPSASDLSERGSCAPPPKKKVKKLGPAKTTPLFRDVQVRATTAGAATTFTMSMVPSVAKRIQESDERWRTTNLHMPCPDGSVLVLSSKENQTRRNAFVLAVNPRASRDGKPTNVTAHMILPGAQKKNTEKLSLGARRAALPHLGKRQFILKYFTTTTTVIEPIVEIRYLIGRVEKVERVRVVVDAMP